MLGEGLRAGLGYMGIQTRAVCHIEREAYAGAVLAARMEEGSMDPAPIWTDLLTFDAAAWRGAVDCIVAGFPCQDLSLAGKRAGLDGARSGLFFDICDIADACGARYLFLENVAGIASATASVVDEAEGALEERAAARVLGELADRGWNAEWITLSASDVGASHGRERWFCWAWRELADSQRDGPQHDEPAENRRRPSTANECGGHVDAPQRAERRASCSAGAGGQQGHDGRRHEAHGGPGEPDEVLGNPRLQHQHLQQREEGAEHQGASRRLADPERHGRHQGRPEPGREQGRPDAAECGGSVADASSPRQQGSQQRRACIDHRGGRKHMDQLSNFVAHSSHLAQAIPDGQTSSESGPDSPPPSAKRLNPAFGELLMGWPVGHTIAEPRACGASAMESWRFALRQHLCSFFDAQE